MIKTWNIVIKSKSIPVKVKVIEHGKEYSKIEYDDNIVIVKTINLT